MEEFPILIMSRHSVRQNPADSIGPNIIGPNIARLVAALLLALSLSTGLTGCVSWQKQVSQFALENRVVQGADFRHRVLTNTTGQLARQRGEPVRWHVYIEGDGQPVKFGGRPSPDPTPRSPLLLPVMAQDPQPALYLGRPCYFDTVDPACHWARWTLERYGEATVASLATALQQQIGSHDELVLIGHSGGGTLAVLLAPRLTQARAVVTLAGNLDLGNWIKANDYSPLPACLDPQLQPPLPAQIRQWHIAGARDTVIKTEWIQAFAARQPQAEVIVLKEADHHSPWADWLPGWLQTLEAAPASSR